MTAFTTSGLELYSKLTDNRIGGAVVEPAKIAIATSSYYEFAQNVTFAIDNTQETKRMFVKWRKPLEGDYWYQLNQIQNNNSGLVSILFSHINNGLSPSINSVRIARIGGTIASGQLLPASTNFSVAVSKLSDNQGYRLSVNDGQFTFDFNPDSLTEDNADEINFTIE
jgi:hypothetical protein